MYKAGKINNTVTEMAGLEIDVMGISEMRRPGNGKCVVDNHKVYHSGNENNKHIYGISIIVSRRLQAYIIHFTLLSERIIVHNTTY